MLRRRLHERDAVYYDLKPKHSASAVFVERPPQLLRELGVEKLEPILLRCSSLQRTHFIQVDTLQRTSEIYKILHEFHTAVTQSVLRLVPSLETDEWPIRYAFASISGRSTLVQLRSSPVYVVHWHVISSSKQVQIKHRRIARLSSESILPPMKVETAERWHMNWEYVVYRISHGVHFAIVKNITDTVPLQKVLHIRMQKYYARRFTRSNIAPIQKKKTIKASESYSIKMCTVDRGEPCRVKRINIPECQKYMPTNCHSTTPAHIASRTQSAMVEPRRGGPALLIARTSQPGKFINGALPRRVFAVLEMLDGLRRFVTCHFTTCQMSFYGGNNSQHTVALSSSVVGYGNTIDRCTWDQHCCTSNSDATTVHHNRQESGMFRMVFLSIIFLLHLCAEAYPIRFPSTAPISPYIGSMPDFANAKTHDGMLKKILSPPSNSYSNGFFWPPPRTLVAQILQRYILQSSGLAGLNLGSLRLGGLGLGTNFAHLKTNTYIRLQSVV
ncbi:unnamed protein product [Litomosoides sigmodontis]|uniref:Uncharacterized protein n=1 Tax=Litomosoides sigmodontis TaxID=42156 RepID=A0A3P6TXJ5_LITSI|nr:unnamed protein product [Litomosoides sigmodontis]